MFLIFGQQRYKIRVNIPIFINRISGQNLKIKTMAVNLIDCAFLSLTFVFKGMIRIIGVIIRLKIVLKLKTNGNC